MYPGVELRVMRYFLAVAAELHFTRAAERSHVAQPSLSKQIRNLEEELGVDLLKRNRHRVELTEPGRAFAENAEQALLYAERAAAMARAAGAGQRGKLLIAVSPAVDFSLYLRVRDAFRRQYPDVQVEAVSAFAAQQAERLMRSDLHAGLIELPIRYRGLDVLNLSREPIIFAVPLKDGLASAKLIVPAQIQDRTLVLVSEDADLAYNKILAGLKMWGYRPEKIQRVLTLSQVLDFVAAGDGIAALRASVERFRQKAIAYRASEGLPMLDTAIAYRRNIRTPLVRNLLRVVRQEFAEDRRQMRNLNQERQC
jgi:DNA-binding transcriptional LysR family regulator